MSDSSPQGDQQTNDQWLVRFAVTNLLDYILDTEDLSVIRGSSVELEDFVADQAKQIHNPKNGIKTIYAKASEMLISTPSENSARKVVQQLEADFKKGDSRFATAASAIAKLPAGQPLKSIIPELEKNLRQQQMSRPSVVPPDKLRGPRACEIEGIRPAEEQPIWYKDGTRRNVSGHVERRYKKGQGRRTGLVWRIFQEESKAVRLEDWEQSFSDLECYNRPDQIERGTAAAVNESGSVC